MPYVAKRDFRNAHPSPWVPLPTLIITVSIFTITYFQHVDNYFSLTLYNNCYTESSNAHLTGSSVYKINSAVYLWLYAYVHKWYKCTNMNTIYDLLCVIWRNYVIVRLSVCQHISFPKLPRKRLLIEKLRVAQIVKKLSPFYGASRFITIFTGPYTEAHSIQRYK